MRVLVTGAAGFVGRYALRELAAAGHTPLALDLASPAHAGAGDLAFHPCDLRDAAALARLVATLRPDACLHLAGIAAIPQAEADPDLAFTVNVNGTVHLLEALRQHAPAARLLVITSAQIYGTVTAAQTLTALTEEAPLRPQSLYAITKATIDQTTLYYARHWQLPAMTARPHNHIGPGQSADYAVSAFARQIKALARGAGEAELQTGNLDSQRDFTDVRDMVRAYRLLLENGRAGQAYNFASGQMIRIGAILQQLCTLAGVHPRFIADPQRYRDTDASPLLDTGKLRADTGWKPQIDIATSLCDILKQEI